MSRQEAYKNEARGDSRPQREDYALSSQYRGKCFITFVFVYDFVAISTLLRVGLCKYVLEVLYCVTNVSANRNNRNISVGAKRGFIVDLFLLFNPSYCYTAGLSLLQIMQHFCDRERTIVHSRRC